MPNYTFPRYVTGENRRDDSILPPCRDKTVVTRRLLIDSRDADANAYQPFDFTIRLDPDVSRSRYTNIETVELKLASIPKVANEQYVVLDIQELRDSNLDASNQAAHESFAVVYFDNSSLAAGAYKPMDKFFSQKTTFSPPIGSIDRLHVTVRKQDGNIVTKSETANVEDLSFMLDVTMSK
ncbi:MAG: hypothetical protein ACO35C_04355 [Pontimonas sp.]